MHSMIRNRLALALLERLNLDPKQVTGDGFKVEVSEKSMVTVRWEGITLMTLEEFQRVVRVSEPKVVEE